MRISANDLRETCDSLLAAIDCERTIRMDCSEALIQASLSGVDTHGIALLPGILKRVEDGRSQVKVPAQIRYRDGDAVASIDGNLTPGQHSTFEATRLAMKLACEFGIGFVSVKNSTHFGCCTPFLMKMAEAGLVGLVGSNSLRSMAAFEATVPNLGNNPFGFVSPAHPHPFLFDFSSAKMSFGRRAQLRRAGETVPPGNFVVPESVSDEGICEIADSLEEIALPFGGHKGASMAVAIEVLSGLLANGAVGKQTETFGEEGLFLGASHFVLALQPERYNPDYTSLATSYFAEMHRGQNLRLPGDRAASHRLEREREGIPLSADVLDAISSWSSKLGVVAAWER